MHGWARRSREKSGRVHGARSSRFNRNAECRRSGCAGDRADAPARARGRELRPPGSNTDMNRGANSCEPMVQTVLRKTQPASQELRPPDLRVHWLGRTDFANALALQEEIVAKKRADPSHPDELLLLEHEPVYTIGRTHDQSSLSATGRIRRGELGAAHLPHPLFAINRGGQATYHGPGQLMGYPIIDLRRCGQDLHRYLRWLEQLLIELLANYGITAWRREALTGVWIDHRKIASIGVGVRNWITMHGFALNVCGDLSPFNYIIPCGINNVAMTSMEKETGKGFSVVDVARVFEKLALDRIIPLRIAQKAQPVNV